MKEESASSPPVDLAIAEVAARQHGVVSLAQLTELGVGKNAVTRRVRRGNLHRVHRGVYAVGHPIISRHGEWMAAVLACGAGAVLSHRSAAALWDLLRPIDGPPEVSVPSQHGRARRSGIRVHRCASLRGEAAESVGTSQPGEDDRAALVTRRRGIPVTTPARTIADLRGAVPPRLWRRAVRQSEIAGYSLGPEVETDRTRSDLERDFLSLCRRAKLPAPQVNVRVGR
jgi:predicted transcriptional regulator of viral defense system